MRVTFEVWREPDNPKIHLKLVEGSQEGTSFTVDPRAHYSGGNPKLYKTLDSLLKEEASG